MTAGPGARRCGAAACAVLLGVIACSGPRDTTPNRPAGVSLPPVVLPDLSTMAPSVQQQIRAAHADLERQAAAGGAPPTGLGDAYGALGKLLMAAQSYEAAAVSFRNAQSLNTADYRWPYYLAQVHRALGQTDQAMALFDRTLQLRPDDVASLVWLGDLNLQVGRADAAEPLFTRALALQANSLSARYGLGRAALARNDYARAVTYLEDVLARDPKAASAHYPLSTAYAALGDARKAEEHLRLRANHEILPADPLMVELEGLLESPQTYETQGIRALEREDWPAAADQFRKGLALAPDSPALHHRLGTALSMMGDKDGARGQFLEAVRLSPDYFLSQFSLGVLEQARGSHDEAVRRFDEALRARPIYTEARLRRASSLRRLGQPARALKEYETVLASNADQTEARIGYAMALVQLGRDREARTRLEAAAKGPADAPLFAHALARVLAASRDDAVRDGPLAMSLVQDLIKQGRTLDLGETLAMTLAELGQFDQAASVQRDLLVAARKGGLTRIAARLDVNLARYERRTPCRTPWTVDEMP